MKESRFHSVRKQLEAYGESWKKDHEEAMQCRDLEDFLAVGVSVYQLIKNREQSWHNLVFEGQIEYDAEEEQELAALHEGWMETAKQASMILPVAFSQMGRTGSLWARIQP